VPVANVVVNSACVTGFEGGMVAHDSHHASLPTGGRCMLRDERSSDWLEEMGATVW
jgi:hypothetical protein